MTETCGAFTTNKTRVLPLKSKKLAKKERFFAYLIFVYKRKVWIVERPEGDIWRHLNEFFLLELGSVKALKTFTPEDLLMQMEVVPSSLIVFDDIFEQMLTHQRIHARFFILNVSSKPRLPDTGKWIPLQQVREHAFPKTIRNFLDSYPLT
jgi:A/G-specific adenine glycosylase